MLLRTMHAVLGGRIRMPAPAISIGCYDDVHAHISADLRLSASATCSQPFTLVFASLRGSPHEATYQVAELYGPETPVEQASYDILKRCEPLSVVYGPPSVLPGVTSSPASPPHASKLYSHFNSASLSA